MDEHTSSKKGGVFSFLYRTRVGVSKGETDVINLSLLFTLISVISAPWLALGGGIAALALGYRFSIRRDAEEFTKDFDDVIKDAVENVKTAADSVKSTVGGHE